MKKLILLVVLVALTFGFWKYMEKRERELGPEPEKFMRGEEEWVKYNNPSLGLYFEYRKNPDGYTVVNQNESQVPHQEVIEFLSIFNIREYEELQNATTPRDGPPTISILIFNNPEGLTSKQWANQNLVVSGTDRAISPVTNFTIAGLQAVRYTTDGLYPSDTIAIVKGNRAYLISGAYLDESSQIRKDFLEMLQYFSFL